jgi:beta-galactosidase
MKTKPIILKSFFTCLLTACIHLSISTQALAQENVLTRQGSFSVGCNYWASHAGTHMWRDWRPEIIEQDFRLLSENYIRVLRVFPLWPDFQPICQIYSGGGTKKFIGFKDAPLPATGPGSNGVSEEQLNHFQVMADIAQKYNLQLIVGLVTGWMSGQLYVPPALEGKNILTDPESLMWQQKLVTTFVSRFKGHSAIIGWDFGNECNVMENVDNYYQAYVWSSVISGAIRSEDKSRPVVSGMHGLSVSDYAQWRIADQAALTDVLTTHPYSLFTPYAGQDPVNSIRTLLHSAAESRLYADIGGKPCLTEETGVLGPMTAGEKEKAAFARTALFSNWVHDCKGMLWWCGFDQLSLDFSPYNYSAVEQQLGLFREDRSPKPVLVEFRNFSNFLEKLPFKTLPPRKTEAVCILTEGQDNWAAAYSSFILAKQAGFDIQFQKSEQELRDSKVYLLPSVKGFDVIFKNSWYKILDRVNEGATLYISLDFAYMPTLTSPVGFEIKSNIQRRGVLTFVSKIGHDSLNFETSAERKLNIDPLKCTVLAKEPDGNPAFIMSQYGKGKIYLLTFPLETNLATTTGAFDKRGPAWCNIYKLVARDVIDERIFAQDNPYVGVTEHNISDNEKVIVLINYNYEDASSDFRIKEGWKISECLYGKIAPGKSLTLNANDAIALVVKKNY